MYSYELKFANIYMTSKFLDTPLTTYVGYVSNFQIKLLLPNLTVFLFQLGY